MRKVLMIVLLVFELHLKAQNSDVPVVGDLADQKSVARAKLDREIGHVQKLEAATDKLARVPDSSNAKGVRAQIQLKKCLAESSYHRELAGIYAKAEGSAGQLAEGFATQSDSASSANTALAQLQQQLSETQKQESALAATASPDLAGMEELKALESRLKEAIVGYQTVRARSGPAQVETLRQMQRRFSITQQEYQAAAASDDADCINQHQILQELARAEMQKPQIDSLTKLLVERPDSQQATGGTKLRSTTPQERDEIRALQGRVQVLQKQLKTMEDKGADYDQILYSIPALQQRLNELRQKESGSVPSS